MIRGVAAVIAIGVLWIGLSWPMAAYAQQRTFINGGFEQNDPRGPGTPTFQIYDDTVVPEWMDETGFIEIWDSGFQSTPSFEGDRFAELNANSAGSLFQEICLINGETLQWSFAHRARNSSSLNPQTVIFELADTSSGAQLVELSTQTTFIGDGWNVNTDSIIYGGTSSVVRAQFRTNDTGSIGNFLDDLQFDVAAFAQLTAAASQDVEEVGGNIPQIEIFGRVDSVTSLPIIINGGSADGGDFTQSATTVDIPVGLYDGEVFPLPISIIEDAISEADDTIDISLGTPSSGEIIYARPECDGVPAITSTTYTIVNDDGRLEAEKSVTMFSTGGSEVYSIPGEDVIYTIRIRNTGNTDIDSGSVFLADRLPPELRFYNDDLDDAGPETNAVGFIDSGSGLSFTFATDVGFSNSTVPPTTITDCNFTPAIGYVETVTFLCFSPQGSFLSGDPDPFIEISYRMQIK